MAVALFLGLAGCASGGGSAGSTGNADATCADLNLSIGETSKELSAAAISRGKVDRFNVPFWLPGATKAVSTLKGRQSRGIEGLAGRLAEMREERDRRCPRS